MENRIELRKDQWAELKERDDLTMAEMDRLQWALERQISEQQALWKERGFDPDAVLLDEHGVPVQATDPDGNPLWEHAKGDDGNDLIGADGEPILRRDEYGQPFPQHVPDEKKRDFRLLLAEGEYPNEGRATLRYAGLLISTYIDSWSFDLDHTPENVLEKLSQADYVTLLTAADARHAMRTEFGPDGVNDPKAGTPRSTA